MKNVSKYLLIVIIGFIFMSVGYASINSISLDLLGNLTVDAQNGIFITAVKYVDSSGVDIDDITLNAHQTLLKNKIILSAEAADSYVTYSITIYNCYDMDFSYVETIYNDDFYDNENIIFDLNFSNGETVNSNDYLTFDITFKYGDDVVPNSDINELNSYLNFLFLHEVDYIESTGTQYIDTLITADSTVTFEMCLSLNDLESTYAIFGTRIAMDTTPWFNLFFYKNSDYSNYRLRWDENLSHLIYADLSYSKDKLITILHNGSSITFSTSDSTDSVEIPDDEWMSDNNIYIFSQNQIEAGETRHALINLYYLKMYKNNELVRNFIPVLDENGVACLFDLVSQDYFYNSGTGDFLYN